MTYKLLPRIATLEMQEAGQEADFEGSAGNANDVYEAMHDAAPEIDEAAVERLAFAMFESFFTGDDAKAAWNRYTESEKRGFREAVRAVLTALEEE